jgi:hypothetical protein
MGYLESGTAVGAIEAGKWAKKSHEILERQLAANLALLEEQRKTNAWLAHIAGLLGQSAPLHSSAPGTAARPAQL